MKLPQFGRPRLSIGRQFQPGLDLPSWFYHNLKGIDQDFHLVYHPYKTMWDSIINQYEGPIEDPRYTIHREFGEEVWGWPLTDGQGYPRPDHKWHLWRLCWPHGWGHILCIEDAHDYYLRLVQKRLYLQSKFTDRYGFRAWSRQLDDEHTKEAEIRQKDKQALFESVQEENKWLTKRAMEELHRGNYKPTNPKRDVITSYSGQTNRSRIEVPLSDTEGGLVIP